MGGFGPDRDEHATTPTVGDCRALNVNEFTDAVEHPGTSATIRWGPEDDPSASIGYIVPEDTEADPDTLLAENATWVLEKRRNKTRIAKIRPIERSSPANVLRILAKRSKIARN